MCLSRMLRLTSLWVTILTFTLICSGGIALDNINEEGQSRFWPDRNWNTDYIGDPREARVWEQYKLKHHLEEKPEIKLAGLEHLARAVLSLRIELIKAKQKCAHGRGVDVGGDWWLPKDLEFGFFPPAYPKADEIKFRKFMRLYDKPNYSTTKPVWAFHSEFDFRCYVYILRMRINQQRKCLKMTEVNWGERQDLSVDEITPVVVITKLSME